MPNDPVIQGIMQGAFKFNPVEAYQKGRMAGYNLQQVRKENELAKRKLQTEKELFAKEADLRTTLKEKEIQGRERLQKDRLKAQAELTREELDAQRDIQASRDKAALERKQIATPLTEAEKETERLEQETEKARAAYYEAMAEKNRAQGDDEAGENYERMAKLTGNLTFGLQQIMALAQTQNPQAKQMQQQFGYMVRANIAAIQALAEDMNIEVPTMEQFVQEAQQGASEPTEGGWLSGIKGWVGKSAEERLTEKRKRATQAVQGAPQSSILQPQVVATYIEELRSQPLPKSGPMESKIDQEGKQAAWVIGLSQINNKYLKDFEQGRKWDKRELEAQVKALRNKTMKRAGGSK